MYVHTDSTFFGREGGRRTVGLRVSGSPQPPGPAPPAYFPENLEVVMLQETGMTGPFNRCLLPDVVAFDADRWPVGSGEGATTPQSWCVE